MKREIYDEDHEAFRSSVKEFLDRSVIPQVEQHATDMELLSKLKQAARRPHADIAALILSLMNNGIWV
mgnify:CR=1 FL=1